MLRWNVHAVQVIGRNNGCSEQHLLSHQLVILSVTSGLDDVVCSDNRVPV